MPAFDIYAKRRQFVAESVSLGLVFPSYEACKSEKVVFQFYCSDVGNLFTPIDPILVAKLVLLGRRLGEAHYGYHGTLLELFAHIPTISNPAKDEEGWPSYVLWDYDFLTKAPKISLRDWLCKELRERRTTLSERLTRYEFRHLMAEVYNEELDFMEPLLWWLPK